MLQSTGQGIFQRELLSIKKCNYFSEIVQNNKFFTFNYLFYKTFMICQLLIKSKVKVNKGFTAEE